MAIIACLFWSSKIAPVKSKAPPLKWSHSAHPLYYPPEKWTALPVWSPDGKLIAISNPLPMAHQFKYPPDNIEQLLVHTIDYPSLNVNGYRPATAILDARTYEVLSTVPISIFATSWSMDSSYLMGSTFDGGTAIVELATGKISQERNMHKFLMPHAWSPAGHLLALAPEHGVQIWDPLNRAAANVLSLKDSKPVSIDWSPDGRQIAAATASRYRYHRPYLTIWDAATAKPLFKKKSFDGFGKLGWSKSGKYFAYCDHDIKVINADTFEEIVTLKTVDFPELLKFEWSNVGEKIAYKGLDRKLHVYDMASSHDILVIPADKQGQYTYGWSPHDTYLSIVSRDFAIICDANTGNYLATTPVSSFAMTQWMPDESAAAIQITGNYNQQTTLKFMKVTKLGSAHAIVDPWQNQRIALNLNDCLERMPQLINDNEASQLKLYPEEYIYYSRYGNSSFLWCCGGPLDERLVEEFALKQKTPVVDYFNSLGLKDPYSMSNLILRAYRHKIMGAKLDLRQEVAQLKEVEKRTESELYSNSDPDLDSLNEFTLLSTSK